MRVAIIGGKLQGVEAVYLARKAGWETVVVDRRASVPASALCDVFVQADVCESGFIGTALKDVDLVVPAIENDRVLSVLVEECQRVGIPLAFDSGAYRVSSSKLESDRLFGKLGVPAPEVWPGCGFPMVAKPSGGSGSDGVRIFHDLRGLEERFPGEIPPEGWVMQEYVEGPSYSLEVVGVPGDYHVLQVTDLEMDAGYDCKRVTASTVLDLRHVEEFERIAVQVAEAIKLRGLMDIEVILHKGELKVLEIDARLPSQTPTVVFHSTGINMLQMLLEYFPIKQNFLEVPRAAGPGRRRQRGVIYEHIKVIPGLLEVCGEHIMTGGGPLSLHSDLFGANEVITNYVPGCEEWVATLIIVGSDRAEAWAKRERVVKDIRSRFDLNTYLDPFPPGMEVIR